jgi:hypothetical protein
VLGDITPRKQFRIPKIWEGKMVLRWNKGRDKTYKKALSENWLQYKIERNEVGIK